MSTVDREIRFKDYDRDLSVIVAKIPNGKWVIAADQDMDELFAADLVPEVARSVADLLLKAADECDALNAVKAEPDAKKTRIFRDPNDGQEWHIFPDGTAKVTFPGLDGWADSCWKLDEMINNTIGIVEVTE